MAAIDAGAWYCIHTFNGMKPFHHRDPGPIAAVLSREHVHCEIIADGVHNHIGALRLLVRAKGCDRTLLVSDAIALAGSEQASGTIARSKVEVRGDAAQLGNGTLAGGVRALDHGLRVAVQALEEEEGLPKVLRTVSQNQARVLGHENQLGGLAPGMAADLVVLDRGLRVRHVVLRGRPVHIEG
jgi:N-acetylglucosamine-6-phosphate deacetylase